MKTFFKSGAIYVSGLPVGKAGDNCTFSVTEDGLHLFHPGLTGKWKYDIAWEDVRGARTEVLQKRTLTRLVLGGLLFGGKKKIQSLIISYGPENFVADLILTKLNAPKAQQAILKAKMPA